MGLQALRDCPAWKSLVSERRGFFCSHVAINRQPFPVLPCDQYSVLMEIAVDAEIRRPSVVLLGTPNCSIPSARHMRVETCCLGQCFHCVKPSRWPASKVHPWHPAKLLPLLQDHSIMGSGRGFGTGWLTLLSPFNSSGRCQPTPCCRSVSSNSGRADVPDCGSARRSLDKHLLCDLQALG